MKVGHNMIPLHFAPSTFEVKDEQAQYRGSLYFNDDGHPVSFSFMVTAIRGSWRQRMEIDILRETGEHVHLDSQAFDEKKFQGSCRVKTAQPEDALISLDVRSSGMKAERAATVQINSDAFIPEAFALTRSKVRL